MSERNRGNIRVQARDGTLLTAITRFRAHDTYTDPLTRFEFDAAPPRSDFNAYRDLLTKGEFVTLKINGASQGGFLIETVRTRISAEHGCTFSVQAVNPLITPHQGSVDPDVVNVSAQTDIPLSDTILKALGPYGFDRIVTDTRASVSTLTGFQVRGKKPDSFAQKLKIQNAQAQHGESAYQFCARLFTHLGVCLRLNPDGVLLVGAPDYTQDPIATLVQASTPGAGPQGDHFIGDVEIADTNDDQFSHVIVRGNQPVDPQSTQTSRPSLATMAAALPAGSDVNAFIRQGLSSSSTTANNVSVAAGVAFTNGLSFYKSTPAAYKPKVIQDKHARDNDRCASVGKLVLGLRAAHAWQLHGVVDGFVSSTGAVWSVDTVVNVYVEAYGLSQPLWVLEREFNLDGNGGSTTRLVLIPLGSLLLGEVPSS